MADAAHAEAAAAHNEAVSARTAAEAAGGAAQQTAQALEHTQQRLRHAEQQLQQTVQQVQELAHEVTTLRKRKACDDEGADDDEPGAKRTPATASRFRVICGAGCLCEAEVGIVWRCCYSHGCCGAFPGSAVLYHALSLTTTCASSPPCAQGR